MQSSVLKIMIDIRALASKLKSSHEQLRPIEYDTLKKNVTFCDMMKHAYLCTLGHFVRNQHTFNKLALNDVSCHFGKSMPIP